jgi:Amt family ammonium transporter
MHGDAGFLIKQVGAVALGAVYAFAFTYAMLGAINVAAKVKVSPADEEAGLDETLHGEHAYL